MSEIKSFIQLINNMSNAYDINTKKTFIIMKLTFVLLLKKPKASNDEDE